MSKNYHKTTDRSRQKMICLPSNAAKVQTADGQARLQMILPMGEWIKDVATAIEQIACKAGLLAIKALIDEEVELLAGRRYEHQDGKPAVRWGTEEGSIVFAGRKVAWQRPRVRSQDGREILLNRYAALRQPARMQEVVDAKILRRFPCGTMKGFWRRSAMAMGSIRALSTVTGRPPVLLKCVSLQNADWMVWTLP